MEACGNWTRLYAELNLIIKHSEFFLFLPAVFRRGTVTSRTFQSMSLCGQKEPFAVLISGGYTQVRLRVFSYTRLKARYFVVNNTDSDGKFTVRVI